MQTEEKKTKEEINEKEQTTNPDQEPTVSNEEKKEESQANTTEDEVQKLNDKFLRLFAEFENYKKRTSRERVELFGTANRELMQSLLPVLDDFERAFRNIDEEDEKQKAYSSGYRLIYQKMYDIMTQKGLKAMEDSTGKKFDVETMEAITRIPAPSKDLKGKVIDEVERGYTLGNAVIRYAKVVIGE